MNVVRLRVFAPHSRETPKLMTSCASQPLASGTTLRRTGAKRECNPGAWRHATTHESPGSSSRAYARMRPSTGAYARAPAGASLGGPGVGPRQLWLADKCPTRVAASVHGGRDRDLAGPRGRLEAGFAVLPAKSKKYFWRRDCDLSRLVELVYFTLQGKAHKIEPDAPPHGGSKFL